MRSGVRGLAVGLGGQGFGIPRRASVGILATSGWLDEAYARVLLMPPKKGYGLYVQQYCRPETNQP